MIYFDSSALVKRYIEEAGSKEINKLLQSSEKAVTSRLAYPEILSAITRRHRAGDIESPDCERIKREFRVDWGYYTIIEVHSELFNIIDKLIDKHALRGADCIH
jgi:predicted nucleic acid-binding protein